MSDNTVRAVRVIIPCAPAATPSSASKRRGRIRALSALSAILIRDNLEALEDISYRYTKDARGHWTVATVTARPHTWRTYRERYIHGCRHCGRRNFTVRETPEGWQCADPEECKRRAARARRCHFCAALGTPWAIQDTDHGPECKDTTACAARRLEATVP